VRKADPTPACSPVSDRRRSHGVVEVHWARRVQALMPQMSKSNFHATSEVELLITNYAFCIVQRAAAQLKTGIFQRLPQQEFFNDYFVIMV
jgi:hypothetical protein